MKRILAVGLAVALGAIGYAWHRGTGDSETDVLAVGPRRHLVVRAAEGRPLLVLLHGRGMTPQEMAMPELLDALDALGERAPTVVLADGGDHSYYHDRADFDWGTHVLELVNSAPDRLATDPDRVAIGGFSIGGFGARYAAELERC